MRIEAGRFPRLLRNRPRFFYSRGQEGAGLITEGGNIRPDKTREFPLGA